MAARGGGLARFQLPFLLLAACGALLFAEPFAAARQLEAAEGSRVLVTADGQGASSSGVHVIKLSRRPRRHLGRVLIAQTTAINLLTNSGFSYYADIFLGSNGQAVTVIFDTGSADLVVPGSECVQESGAACEVGSFYDKSASSTSSTISNGGFTIEYLGGTVYYCTTVKDTVKVGSIVVQNQVFGDIYRVKNEMSNNFDGILGLAGRGIASSGAAPIFQNMVDQGLVSRPIFSFALTSEGGELVLGGVDPNAYQGNHTYVRVDGSGHWRTSLDNMAFGDASVEACFTRPCYAYIDSGTSLIVGPATVIRRINQYLYNNAGLTSVGPQDFGEPQYLDCRRLQRLPNFIVMMSGVNFTLVPFQYVLNVTASDGSRVCLSGFGTANEPATGGLIWILGDVFMRAFHTIFDYQNKQIGIAAASESSVIAGDLNDGGNGAAASRSPVVVGVIAGMVLSLFLSL